MMKLEKIDRAEQALRVAIRAAEREAEGKDLPTAWFHDGLAYLVKPAKKNCMNYSYARASTDDQNAELHKAGIVRN